MIGSSEIIVVAAVILILFGASAIPKFAKALGQAKKEFEKGAHGDGEAEEASKGERDGKAS
ncbi:MAG TPA: twin-arginine translocase TatA/TatE family subunit [Spirochaetales bacterium]|nr:twin-arginine translocase TatA/TatE family subunit [Spirochaetales bacterium]HRY54914.1 twin-arginine translocase TatA/TatE family subunit [Spirochaetia bacterium]HRZ63501.1 twin-arginine translocase TatA/TatE family subunit [Spirochaetia bacterium]